MHIASWCLITDRCLTAYMQLLLAFFFINQICISEHYITVILFLQYLFTISLSNGSKIWWDMFSWKYMRQVVYAQMLQKSMFEWLMLVLRDVIFPGKWRFPWIWSQNCHSWDQCRFPTDLISSFFPFANHMPGYYSSKSNTLSQLLKCKTLVNFYLYFV